MFEPKPIASLCSSLLARKGDARPAIRRTHVSLGSATFPAEEPGSASTLSAAPGQQQARIARAYASRPGHMPKPAVSTPKAKAAFTLRLDPDRHLRLRLASAVGKRSAQQIVIQALDALLDRQPGLDDLAAQARLSRES